MGVRLNRTLLNWRWWVVLPLVPPVLALCVVHWCFRQAVYALDTTEQMSGEIFNWMRKGSRP